MKYIIMADGKATRWQNHNEIPKHLIVIDGETILARTVRLLKKYDSGCEVIITSHDPRYEVEGAVRHEPENNVLEIDRFTSELIGNDICFLYGDTYYSEKAIETVASCVPEDIMFFGNGRSIVAIKISDGELFRRHVERVRRLFLEGKLEKAIGWQVYQSFAGLPFGDKTVTEKFVTVDDATEDFNTPEDYEKRIRR